MTMIHCQSCGEPAPTLEVRRQDDGRYFCAICNSKLVPPQLHALLETCWPAGTRLEEVFTGEPPPPPARERLAPEIPRPIDTPLDFGAAQIASLKAELAVAQAEIERLKDPIKAIKLRRLEIGDKEFAVEMEAGMVQPIMAEFAELFNIQQAVNYIGWEAVVDDEKYMLTFQRFAGENPATKAARLESIIQSDQQRMRDAGERCGIPYEGHGCDWPEWVADALIGEREKTADLEATIEAMIHGL